ncbi:hypothetical protein QL285_047142 [Trifolium repens]|nr:hypothetical protein QL285_047142 [Trifolium repens]
MGRGRGRPRKLVLPSPHHQLKSTPAQRTTPSVAVATPVTAVVTEEGTDEALQDQTPTPDVIETNSDPLRDTTPKLWVDVLSGNRNPANGLAMEFVAPTRVDGEAVVDIDATDVESEVNFWAPSLIMYALGSDLSMSAVKQFMLRNWNFVKLPDMFYNEEGYFILRFHSFQDKESVMMQGPYTIRNMPMLLRDWKPNFSLKRDMLRTLPIWIKLPQLPLYLWGARSLSKICSALGNPLVTDECTAHKLRISYARMLVEIDVTQALPQDITIRS